MLTQKQAISKIKKVFNERFKHVEDTLEFYIDIEREDIYAWHFINRFKTTYFITCNRKNGEVKVVEME